jgi:hypothetical protein
MWRPVESSKGPEREKRDRTRQVNADLTRPNVPSSHYSFARASHADVTVRQAPPDVGPVRLITPPCRLPTSDRRVDRARASVRSFFSTLGQSMLRG